MGNDGGGLKRPVNLTLDADLVRRARQFTPNLSETVAALLAAYVAQSEASNARLDQQIDDYIRASDAFAAEHGSLADEFPTL